jgi:opine dehydrogenase
LIGAFQPRGRAARHTRRCKDWAAPARASRTLSVAVLGAGHGGLALAGFLSRGGHRVALWNRSAERIASIEAGGGVHLTVPGGTATVEPIELATTDMATALRDAGIVLVAVPASGHADIAWACAPYLRDGQTVLLLPGRTGGSLEFRRVLRACGCRAEILLGEANSFPFAARTVAPAEAVIYGTKAELITAALPTRDTAALVAKCRPVLAMLAPARSVLQTGLSNLGAILHPTITLLNAGRIARKEAFDFYAEGVTPRVADMLSAADQERLRIARAYGEQVESLLEWVASAYGHRAETMERAIAGNPAYIGIKAPATIHHRYLLEDVPTGLIPLIELGTAAGLTLPTLRSLVTLAEVTLGIDTWRQERSLQSLGLNDLAIPEIRSLITTELPPTKRHPASAEMNGYYGSDLAPPSAGYMERVPA